MSIKMMGQKYPSPLYFNNNSELAQNKSFQSHNNNSSSAALHIETPISTISPFPHRAQNRANPGIDEEHRGAQGDTLILPIVSELNTALESLKGWTVSNSPVCFSNLLWWIFFHSSSQQGFHTHTSFSSFNTKQFPALKGAQSPYKHTHTHSYL